jgi:hypothetical protein
MAQMTWRALREGQEPTAVALAAGAPQDRERTHLLRVIRVVVPVAVLTLASSAWAESAWVLWEQQRTPLPEPPAIDTRAQRPAPAAVDTWIIVDTFATKIACEGRRAQFREPFSLSEDVMKGFTGPRYVCLPDSEDPRGPKASGR